MVGFKIPPTPHPTPPFQLLSLELVDVTLFEKQVCADGIKLRILTREDHPGFSVWALNAIVSVRIGERQRRNSQTVS